MDLMDPDWRDGNAELPDQVSVQVLARRRTGCSQSVATCYASERFKEASTHSAT